MFYTSFGHNLAHILEEHFQAGRYARPGWLLKNGILMLQPVAVTSHDEYLAIVGDTVQDGGGNHQVSHQFRRVLKFLVGSDNKRYLFE